MSKSIYTRKRLGLDNNVLLTMLVFIILSTGLFGYNVLKRKEVKECVVIKILVNGKDDSEKNIFHNAGDMLIFRAPVDPADKVSWNFDDQTKAEEGSAVGHAFMKNGIYTVRVLVNGRCVSERRVNIKRPPDIVDSVGLPTEPIINSDPTIVKKPISFTTPVEGASYEWHIENNSNYKKQTGKQVDFTFSSEDSYTVVLVVDGNRQKRYTKTITVIKPSEIEKPKQLIEDEDIVMAPPPKPKQIDTPKVANEPAVVKKLTKRMLTEEQFKQYLQAVVCDGKKAEEFESYLCNGMKTNVVFGKSRNEFNVFCTGIAGKNIKIKVVEIIKGTDNCVESIKVEYEEPRKIIRRVCD